MPEKDDRGLLGIGPADFREIAIPTELSWLEERITRLVQGGIYLLAGPPGIGKSTLGIQLALALGAEGTGCIYILTEQSKEELANRARLMTASWKPRVRDQALRNVKPEDGLYDIEMLPNFLTQIRSASERERAAREEPGAGRRIEGDFELHLGL